MIPGFDYLDVSRDFREAQLVLAFVKQNTSSIRYLLAQTAKISAGLSCIASPGQPANSFLYQISAVVSGGPPVS